MDNELLTADEVATRLKMHPVTVRRLLREGRIPGRKVGSRDWRIASVDLRAYMEGNWKPVGKQEKD